MIRSWEGDKNLRPRVGIFLNKDLVTRVELQETNNFFFRPKELYKVKAVE